MWLYRTRLGNLASLALVGVAVLIVWTVVAVHRVTAPPRQEQTLPDFESMRIRVEEVRFPSVDEVDLSGWWMPGSPDKPAVVLCHDLGTSKRSMVNLAIALRAEGFPVLAFDLRGHGDSAGDRSSLGVYEKRDLIGALDWVEDRVPGPVGVFGAGIGAHAAVLAAAERPALRVLVLDGVYPDASFLLSRELFPHAVWARRGFGFLSSWAYFAFHGTSPTAQRAAESFATLSGTHVLMLAPASDGALVEEMREMVQRVPDQVDSDGNLVVVPATLGDGLYGEQLNRYHSRVTEFFAARLLEPEGELAAGW
jgi:pimeloyl-ACP methyl ester carboxylesterase